MCPAIAKVAFTSEDRVRDVIRNLNADGFGSLYTKYKGGRRRSAPPAGQESTTIIGTILAPA